VPRSGQTWDPERLHPRGPLEPFAHLLAELSEFPEFPSPAELGAWVERGRGERTPALHRLCFVEPRPRPRRAKRRQVEIQELYDARISERGEVPCLIKSYHDLFNAMMFKAFPRSKRALHARQYAALLGWARAGERELPGRRTREQDALTLFDEGGSVVVCPTELEADFEQGMRLVLGRPESAARLVIFGHALVEHLSEGQLELRSSARVLFVPEVPEGHDLLELVDQHLTQLLGDPQRFSQPDADAVVFLQGDGGVSFRRFEPSIRLARIVPPRLALD